MLSVAFPVLSQNISGLVVDEAQYPMPGVSVLVKGTNNGTMTDPNGIFKLDVDTPSPVLVFSFVGYKSQEIALNGKRKLNVALDPDQSTLDEVVVVGYGTEKKANLTGAVTAISGEVLDNRPVTNIGSGLQGMVPNLNITINNGDPTTRSNFNIRGFQSINGGEPLILVDNVPMDIDLINPNDIKSINVLKDASAAAIYGARAAFGVILIETKEGRSGKVRVDFGSGFSMAKPIFKMDVVTDSYEFVQAKNIASVRTNGAPAFDPDYVAKVKAYSENPGTAPEWGVVDGELQYYGYNHYQERIMTDFAPQQQYNLTVKGGGEKSNFYVSFGHINKDGYLKPANNERFKRYNALLKAEFKVNNWLSLDEKVVVNSEYSDKPHFYNWDVNINSLARVSPNMPVQFPDLEYYIEPGDHDKYAQYIGKYFGGTNFFPYLLDGGRATYNNLDLWLTQGVTVTPFKGLKIRSTFSYNNFHRDYQDVQSKVEIVSRNLTEPNLINNGFSGDDWIYNRSNYNQYFVSNTFAEYTKALGKHSIKALVGFNQEWGKYNYISARARSLITPKVIDLNATTGTMETGGGKEQVALRGAFYRLGYNYGDRYIFEANGRYDGTSRFPKERRFGFFPSFSAGWRISEESFMAGTRGVIDNLKLRASYGTLGNQTVKDDETQLYYPYIATMGVGSSPYMFSDSRIPYVSAAGLVSPSLTWETVVSQNLGVDVTLLNQRLDASFDIYTRDTKNMLMNVKYPDILGTSAPKANAADLRTKGWELALTWRDRFENDLSYRFTLALSDWTAEITKYENPSGSLDEYYVGQRLGEIWGFETAGIFQTEDEVASSPDQSRLGSNWRPGDIRYKDLNDDNIISKGSNTLGDPGDRTIIGNDKPRHSFGINIDLKYKNWSLSTFSQGYLHRDYQPSRGNWTWFFPFNSGHVEKYFITDSWSEDNRDAYFPAPHISTNDKKNIEVQSRYLQNAGYIRLKNVTLAYTLPQSLISKAKLSRVQVYFTGMNLWEYSPIRKPLDPESIFSNAIEYPMQRIFTAGINVSL